MSRINAFYKLIASYANKSIKSKEYIAGKIKTIMVE